MRWLRPTAVMTIALLFGTEACSSASKTAVSGTVTLVTDGWTQANGNTQEFSGPCTGAAGNTAIQQGTQVVLTDSSGKTVAVAQLGSGHLQRDDGASGPGADCVFPFSFGPVAVTSSFYGVAVGQ